MLAVAAVVAAAGGGDGRGVTVVRHVRFGSAGQEGRHEKRSLAGHRE